MPDKQNGLDEGSRSELILIAQDTFENIRHVKNVSQAVLLSYTAAFGFLCSDTWKPPNDIASSFLSGVFIAGGLIVIFLCAVFFPKKLSERRLLLMKIYNRFGETFRDVYGDTDRLCRNDGGDYLYAAFAAIYPTILIIIYVLHKYTHA